MTTPPPPLSTVPPRNKIGVIGFIVSIVGLFTCGVLCPVGVVLSFVGVLKKPKGYAIAGLIIGCIGTLVPVILICIYGLALFSFVSCINAGANLVPNMQAASVCEGGVREVQAYARKHGHLPDEASASSEIYFREDIWFTRVRYKRLPNGDFEVRSAGQDHTFDTPDDIVKLGSEVAPVPDSEPTTTTAP